MKVLLIGATGNIGCRLVPALLTHGHTVVAYVRSSNKLESLLPSATFQQISVVEGNAKDSTAVKNAIINTKCDAVVNCAGLAAMVPWSSSDLPEIFRSVLEGVKEAVTDRKKPLRVWFMAGMGVLHFPGTDSLLTNYLPIFREHRINYQLLQELPPNTVDWTMLCPSTMVPESSDFSVPTKSSYARLTGNARTPPQWQDSWIKHIPFIGRTLLAGMNAGRYTTTLEQNADFIAADLETVDSQWSCTTVGIIDGSK
ncbi:Hypothetical protein R9X50_00412600 [Acrodontium crateriforme]|uniref:NAD(P)-binding domain-containing protein n=1 Tax=Acrodontium crateriforme TaxID=150365 RepID=A0AAQ3RCG1_9PEZI|nr:Hypothetical protein R9X50_00412600 [Acrodontium crateriforme]